MSARHLCVASVALVSGVACAAMDAPTAPRAARPYSAAIADSLAVLNARRVAYRSSDIIGHCINPDTLVMWADATRIEVISYRACPAHAP